MLVRSAPGSLGRFLCVGGALDFTDNPIACQENYNSTNRPIRYCFLSYRCFNVGDRACLVSVSLRGSNAGRHDSDVVWVSVVSEMTAR